MNESKYIKRRKKQNQTFPPSTWEVSKMNLGAGYLKSRNNRDEIFKKLTLNPSEHDTSL